MKKRTYLQKKAFTIIIGAFLLLTLIGTKVDGQVLPFGNPFPRFLYFYVPPISPLMLPLLAPNQPLLANTYHLVRDADINIIALPTTIYIFSITSLLTSLPPVVSPFFLPVGTTALIAALTAVP